MRSRRWPPPTSPASPPPRPQAASKCLPGPCPTTTTCRAPNAPAPDQRIAALKDAQQAAVTASQTARRHLADLVISLDAPRRPLALARNATARRQDNATTNAARLAAKDSAGRTRDTTHATPAQEQHDRPSSAANGTAVVRQIRGGRTR
jgi:hypothetical protein